MELEVVSAGTGFKIHLLADSSPRGGKEWLLAEYHLVTDANAVAFMRAQDFLMDARDDGASVMILDTAFHSLCTIDSGFYP
eukprot:5784700-Amphidinium_carterae.1